jgi:hypothetical protein
MLAGQPRGCQDDFSCSRANREAVKAIFLARGPTARLSRRFFLLAGQPRGCQDGFSCSRINRENLRRRATSFFSKIVVHNAQTLYI